MLTSTYSPWNSFPYQSIPEYVFAMGMYLSEERGFETTDDDDQWTPSTLEKLALVGGPQDLGFMRVDITFVIASFGPL